MKTNCWKIEITAPLAVYLPRKTMKDKRIAVNLNTYRNLHFLVNNQAKKIYGDMIREQIKDKVIQTPVSITYRIYKASKRHLDKGNVICVTQKYLLDALTEEGCWIDDNDDFIKTEVMLPTRIDRENPRCEILIQSIDSNKENWVDINKYDDEV